MATYNNYNVDVNVTPQLNQQAVQAIEQLLNNLARDRNININALLNAQSAQAAEQALNNLGRNRDVDFNVQINGGESLDNVGEGLNEVGANANNAAGRVNNLNDGLADMLRNRLGEAAIFNRAFNEIIDTFDRAVDSIIEINGKTVDLQMATGSSYEQAFDLVNEYSELGQVLGATTTEIAKSADAWLRQGYSIEETNKLIEQSITLAKVGQLDPDKATQYLTSSLKGYKLGLDEVSDVVDKLSAVDLVSATDAGGLAEAMSRTAVSANNAEIELDKLIAMLAATGEVSQRSMTTIGESYKTIFQRMSDIKDGKLEVALDADGTTESLSNVETTLEAVGIDLRKTVTEYNSYSEVLDNLADKWDTLTDVQRNALTKAFAGVRQSENFRILMENYDRVREYMQVAENSAGTATEKFQAYQDSIEAHQKKLQAAFESAAINTVSADTVKNIIDATSALVGFIDKAGLAKGALAGIGTGAALVGIQQLTNGIRNGITGLNNFATALDIVHNARVTPADMNNLINITANLSQNQLRLILSSENLTAAQRVQILTSRGLSEEEARQTLATMGLTTAEGAAAGATVTLRGTLQGLWETLSANPIGLVVLAVTAATTAITTLANAEEERRQKAEEAARETADKVKQLENEKKSIDELIEKYKELANADVSDIDTRNEIKGVQEQITDLVGDQAGNLDLVNGKLDEQLTKLEAIRKERAQDAVDAATSSYHAAKTANEGAQGEESFLWSKYAYKGKREPEAEKILEDAGYNLTTITRFDSNFLIYDEYDRDMNKLETATQKAEYLQGMVDTLKAKFADYASSDLYHGLKQQISAYEEFTTAQETAAEKSLEATAYLATFDDKLTSITGDSEEALQKYKETLTDIVINSPDLSEIFKSGDLDSEKVKEFVDSYVSTLPQFQEFYNEANDIVDEALSDMEEPFLKFTNSLGETVEFTLEAFDELNSLSTAKNPFDGMLDSAAEYNKVLKTVRTNVSAVSDAIDEQAKSNKLSAETASKLIETNSNFGKALTYTKDGIELNVTALKNETQALIEVEQQQYRNQITDAQQIIDDNNKIIAAEQAANAKLAEATALAITHSLQNQVTADDKETIAAFEDSMKYIDRLKRDNEELNKQVAEWQGQIDFLNGVGADIRNYNGKTTTTKKEPSTTKKTNTKSYSADNTYYDWADDWLKDQQAEISRLEENSKKIDEQLEKAVKANNAEMIETLTEESINAQGEIQKALARAASEGRNRKDTIASQLLVIAPELDIANLNETDIDKVRQRLKAEVQKQKNIAVDMYNSDNEAKDPNKGNIEAAEKALQTFEAYVKNVQAYNKAFGNIEGEGSFAEQYSDAFDSIIEITEQKFNALNGIFDKGIEEQKSKSADIDLQISLLADDKYSEKMDLIAQQSAINSNVAADLVNEIERIKAEYNNSLLPADEYEKRIKELTNSYNECIKSGKEFEDTLKDIAKEQISNVVSVESDIKSELDEYLSNVEDNANKEIDIAEKVADEKKKLLDKQKDWLKDYQDQLEKGWEAEDERDARREKLDERNEKSTERTKILTAAATGDLEAFSKVQDLDKEIADIDKDLQQEATEQIRDMLKDYISDEIDKLDKQENQLDEQISLMRQQLEETQQQHEDLLKGQSGMDLVHALMNGSTVKLNGKDIDLDGIRTANAAENGSLFSYGYTSTNDEWQKELSGALAAVSNLEALNELSSGNFNLENGSIILGNGEALNLANISSEIKPNISDNLVPVTQEAVLKAIGLSNGERLAGKLVEMGNNLIQNKSILDDLQSKQSQMLRQAEIVNNQPHTINFNYDSFLNVQGNVVEDTIPIIRREIETYGFNYVLNQFAKGLSAKGTGLGSKWIK